ncbi:MAG: diaminopimelate epimerase [Undibacterium sp.]|nr:diaminopimelate epimerase [Undibacterium sp.]
MHGAGNDFIVIDAINQVINFSTEQWRQLADRRFGIGADQILVVEAPASPEVDFCYRIFNADGGEVEQCGNGSRAFVRFVIEQGLTQKRCIRVQTMKGVIEPSMDQQGLITVNMGVPDLAPEACDFEVANLPQEIRADALCWAVPTELGSAWITSVSMGNPHAVQVVVELENYPVNAEGALLEQHPRFVKKVNAGFMQVLDSQHIKLRVFERGVGETLACGTGACAAVVAGIQRGLLTSPCQVSMRGGELAIAWAGVGQPVFLSGPAVTVFQGEIEI